MDVLLDDTNERTIHGIEQFHFSDPPSLYLITVAARVKDFSQEAFLKEVVPGAIFVKQIGDFFFYTL